MAPAYLFGMDAPTHRTALTVENRLPTANAASGIRLGLVRAEGVRPGTAVADLGSAIYALATVLDEEGEARRRAARDMLRNGRYKPTGRGKPASEYLLRAARESAFPRINAVVDVGNLISAQTALPLSLWDLDRAASTRFLFRLGTEGESYVFNASGQTLDLHDLAVGCSASTGAGTPIVSPVKDSHATKTTPETTRLAACVYAPASAVAHDELGAITEQFATWLEKCGATHTGFAVAEPGETVDL